MVVKRSKIYPLCKACVIILVPCTLYSFVGNTILLSHGKAKAGMRSNSALLLTASINSVIFIISWIFAISNTPSRSPPQSVKKFTFCFLLLSTIFWLASFLTGLEVAKKNVACQIALDEKVYPGENSLNHNLTCPLQKVGIVFSIFGFLACITILGCMIEISDRAFGGISCQDKLLWTTEKFREAILEVTAESEPNEVVAGTDNDGLVPLSSCSSCGSTIEATSGKPLVEGSEKTKCVEAVWEKEKEKEKNSRQKDQAMPKTPTSRPGLAKRKTTDMPFLRMP